MHDKSRPAHEAKKPSKTLKQKRAAKREEHERAEPGFLPPRTPRPPA